jgi:hypothetical protein
MQETDTRGRQDLTRLAAFARIGCQPEIISEWMPIRIEVTHKKILLTGDDSQTNRFGAR